MVYPKSPLGGAFHFEALVPQFTTGGAIAILRCGVPFVHWGCNMNILGVVPKLSFKCRSLTIFGAILTFSFRGALSFACSTDIYIRGSSKHHWGLNVSFLGAVSHVATGGSILPLWAKYEECPLEAQCVFFSTAPHTSTRGACCVFFVAPLLSTRQSSLTE